MSRSRKDKKKKKNTSKTTKEVIPVDRSNEIHLQEFSTTVSICLDLSELQRICYNKSNVHKDV